MMIGKLMCVLCNERITDDPLGLGLNPWPLAETGRCCLKCSLEVVKTRVANLAKIP